MPRCAPWRRLPECVAASVPAVGRPDEAGDKAALIARLNPPPSDLRNSKTLHLKSDKQRAQAVREGHPGTGMFPDTTMTSQELADTLAYLALLRNEGSATRK